MKKEYCRNCSHKLYEDGSGVAWREVFEIDIEVKDEACVEFEENEMEE